MSRQKVPVRATFRQMAHSPSHDFPFHLVSVIEDQKRYVITGLTEEQAKDVYKKLGEILNHEAHAI